MKKLISTYNKKKDTLNIIAKNCEDDTFSEGKIDKHIHFWIIKDCKSRKVVGVRIENFSKIKKSKLKKILPDKFSDFNFSKI